MKNIQNNLLILIITSFISLFGLSCNSNTHFKKNLTINRLNYITKISEKEENILGKKNIVNGYFGKYFKDNDEIFYGFERKKLSWWKSMFFKKFIVNSNRKDTLVVGCGTTIKNNCTGRVCDHKGKNQHTLDIDKVNEPTFVADFNHPDLISNIKSDPIYKKMENMKK